MSMILLITCPKWPSPDWIENYRSIQVSVKLMKSSGMYIYLQIYVKFDLMLYCILCNLTNRRENCTSHFSVACTPH